MKLKWPWLEITLGVSIVALILQLLPIVGPWLIWVIDVRNWSWLNFASAWLVEMLDPREWSSASWFVANLLFVAVMGGILWRQRLSKR